MHKLARRARENKIIEDFSNSEWLDKLKSTNGICPICNCYMGIAHLHLDHIYPVSKAYKDFLKTGVKRVYTIHDVQPMCKSCNSRKGDRI